MSQFNSINIPVFGVSADDLKSHTKFATKQKLNYPLLSDPEHALIQQLGLWVEKKFMGRTYMGITRTTYIVGADGRLEHVFEGVKPEGHAQDVLGVLKSLPA